MNKQNILTKRQQYYLKLKKIIDTICALLGSIVLLPIFLILCLVIKIDSKGPILFKQKRVGIGKKHFYILKFRTMKIDTPKDMPTHMLANPEQYITRVGKFLRKTSLDELPQIFNIIRGDMAIVGPRPALWNQYDLIEERDKYGANDILPGLTGWAQINGRDELEVSAKAKLDGFYVKHVGLRMDTICFLRTIFSVLKSEGVVEGGTGQINRNTSETSPKMKKKRILVVCQYYKPEPFRISDICEEMVRRGHEVHVVTGYPNYPEGILYEGYGKGKKIDEIINGVKVHRCYTVPRETGAVKRMLNYYSYAISSVKYVLSKECKATDGKSFDVAFCNQLSPVMMAYAAMAYKKKYKVPVIMYCLDLWPESLIAGGITRESVLYKYYHRVSKNIYKKMDKILITSRMFSEYLQNEFGIEKERIEYLPQYAEGIFEKAKQKETTETFDFMFAGNIGAIQSVDSIIEAASLLKEEPVRFHIIGSGSDLERLEKLGEKAENVIFYGRRPLEEMPDFYAKADAMLITLQADPVLSMTLPGKVQSYMAVGKPIIGAIDGETKKVIEDAKCGYCGKAEDAKALSENIKQFIKNPEKGLMRENARAYYEQHFEQGKFMDQLETVIIGERLKNRDV